VLLLAISALLLTGGAAALSRRLPTPTSRCRSGEGVGRCLVNSTPARRKPLFYADR